MDLQSYNCVFCVDNHEKICSHLFLQCPFARQCWQFIQVQTPDNGAFPEVVEALKAQISSRFFMSAIILISWTIWTSKNKLIFEGIQPSIPRAKVIFKNEMLLLKHRVKQELSLQFF